jgi:photosynthetic reaction center cytochrome c subunit
MTLASVTAFLSALLAIGAGQTPIEPPAALRRPHLEVLTTVPESQLFPIMNAIADSLGVRCDYCHVRNAPDPTKTWSLAGGWVWDRDDKPQKAVAKAMMRMVADINEGQFRGRAIVSCYTCHRGSVAAATFPPLPPREYETGPAPVDVVLKGGDRFRATLRMPPDGPSIQAVNGDSGWIANDRASRALQPGELARLRRAAQRYGVVKVDRPANLRISGIDRIGDRDVHVAMSELDARTHMILFFDAATGLLLRERMTTDTTFTPLQEQIDYEDYRNIDGVMLPFRIRSSDGSPFDTSVKVFTSIQHDVAIDDATFQQSPPPPLQPVTQTAGQRFASVRMLTDMPAGLMIPTMAFISNALGVTCSHCHTDIYESDDKPLKERARQMIRMMRAINDTQFGGRRGVTCQTCHNGRAVPESTPAIENAGWNKPPGAAPLPLPDLGAVLQKYAAAVGVNALARLQNQRLTGTVTRNNGRTPAASASFELYQENPGTLRLTTTLSHPPEADAELPITFLRPPLLQTTYSDLRIIRRDNIGSDSVVVAVGTTSRGTHQLYFSETSGLLVGRSDEIDTPLGAVPEFYDFSHFERVNNVMVPKKIVWSRADYQVTFVVTQIAHQ